MANIVKATGQTVIVRIDFKYSGGGGDFDFFFEIVPLGTTLTTKMIGAQAFSLLASGTSIPAAVTASQTIPTSWPTRDDYKLYVAIKDRAGNSLYAAGAGGVPLFTIIAGTVFSDIAVSAA